MSDTFTIEFARQLANDWAVRHRLDGDKAVPRSKVGRGAEAEPAPLAGQEEALLDSLRLAEAAHAKALDEMSWRRKRRGQLKDGTTESQKLESNLRRALRVWDGMDQQARRDLVWWAAFYRRQGLLDEETPYGGEQPNDEQADRIAEKYQSQLFDLWVVARDSAEGVAFRRGPQSRNDALEAFAWVVLSFWEKATGEQVTEEFVTVHSERLPLSPAANLLVRAAAHLDQGYTASSCQEVMRGFLEARKSRQGV